jgi:ferrous iron transport protein A
MRVVIKNKSERTAPFAEDGSRFMSILVETLPSDAAVAARPCCLGDAARGFRGRIHTINASDHSRALPAEEMERRLIELGFTEGATVEVLHEGFFGRDPIAVRVNDATVALRRREAMAILVV